MNRSVAVLLAVILVIASGIVTPAGAGSIRASWYGKQHHGRTMAYGGRFDMHALTVAHRTLPPGTRLFLRYRGRSAICVVRDHGPAVSTGRSVDLSFGCALAIGMVGAGVATIEMRVLR